MSKIIRFGVSLEEDLVNRFDASIRQQDYATRSKAIGDLIRESLSKQEWRAGNREVAGTVMMVYDHHKRELVNTLVNIQHDYHDLIISSQHVHLDHHNCLEVIVVKGKGRQIEDLMNKLKTQKGVIHIALSLAAPDK